MTARLILALISISMFFGAPLSANQNAHPKSDVVKNIVQKHTRKTIEYCKMSVEEVGVPDVVVEDALGVLKSHAEKFTNPVDRHVVMNARWNEDATFDALSETGRKDAMTILHDHFGLERMFPDLAGKRTAQDREFSDENVKMVGFRQKKDWGGMISFYDGLPSEAKKDVRLRQMLGLALNKRGGEKDWERAIEELTELIKDAGPSGESYGLLASVYKSLWKDYLARNRKGMANVYLDLAIETYNKGFMADQDYYPGVAMITLLYERGRKEDFQRASEAAVVAKFFLQARDIKTQTYWDATSRLKLEIISRNWHRALTMLPDIFKMPAEPWNYETSINDYAIFQRAWARYMDMGLVSADDMDHLNRIIEHFQNAYDEKRFDERLNEIHGVKP